MAAASLGQEARPMSLVRHRLIQEKQGEKPQASWVPWPCRWGMNDELAFLRGLGHWRRLKYVPDRARLLRGYLEGLALRRRWTDLQLEALECEARFLLEELERGGRRIA